MFSKNFFRPMLGILAILLFTFSIAHATDPGKSKSPTNAVNVASAEELANFVRQKTTSVSLSSETGTIRYESPTYFLNSNDLATNVTATYNLSSGNVQSLFIVTKYRNGQQTFTIFPYEQGKTEVSAGPTTAEWMIMELNRINSLSQPNQFIQSTNQTDGTTQPDQPAKLVNKKTQR